MARNLNEMIVEFVNVWNDVVEKKILEYATIDPDKKKALEEENQKIAKDDPEAPFAFIYNWLEVGEDDKGNTFIKPHKAKKRPNDANEPTKMRKNENEI